MKNVRRLFLFLSFTIPLSAVSQTITGILKDSLTNTPCPLPPSHFLKKRLRNPAKSPTATKPEDLFLQQIQDHSSSFALTSVTLKKESR